MRYFNLIYYTGIESKLKKESIMAFFSKHFRQNAYTTIAQYCDTLSVCRHRHTPLFSETSSSFVTD